MEEQFRNIESGLNKGNLAGAYTLHEAYILYSSLLQLSSSLKEGKLKKEENGE